MASSSEYFYDDKQQIILAVTPILSGLVSTIGSSALICNIITGTNRNYFGSRSGRHTRPRHLTTYHRVLLGLSISDFIKSVASMTSNFLVPSGTPGVWQAYGTIATCSLQGFFTQLGLASTMYSASLAFSFAMSIHPHITVETIERKYEPFMHLIPILFSLSTAVAGVILDAYNPVQLGIGCWVGAYPFGCLDDDIDIECTRGKDAETYMWAFGGVVSLLSFVVLTASMLSIYISVRCQVRRMETRYSSDRFGGESCASSNSKKRLQRISTQSFLYIAAFFLTYIWSGTSRALEFNGNRSLYFGMSFMSQVFYPMQGFFNFFIYMRPFYIELRTKNAHLSRKEAIKIILGFSALAERQGSSNRQRSKKSSSSNKQQPAIESLPIQDNVQPEQHDSIEEKRIINDVAKSTNTSCHVSDPAGSSVHTSETCKEDSGDSFEKERFRYVAENSVIDFSCTEPVVPSTFVDNSSGHISNFRRESFDDECVINFQKSFLSDHNTIDQDRNTDHIVLDQNQELSTEMTQNRRVPKKSQNILLDEDDMQQKVKVLVTEHDILTPVDEPFMSQSGTDDCQIRSEDSSEEIVFQPNYNHINQDSFMTRESDDSLFDAPFTSSDVENENGEESIEIIVDP